MEAVHAASRNPDKKSTSLFGRDDEAQALREAFTNCFGQNQSHAQQHLVLLHGSSGSGKTALATQTLRPLLAKQDGLFLSGKADATAEWSRPYNVFVSAFQQLIQLLENSHSDSGLREVRSAILKEFGGDTNTCSDDGNLLNSIIPGFERVLHAEAGVAKYNHSSNGKSTVAEAGLSNSVSGTEAVARLRYLLSRLCRAVSSQRSLVLFLDDIQWCDRASLQLLTSILLSSGLVSRSSSSTSLMIVCAYRDDDEYIESSTQEENQEALYDEKKSEDIGNPPLLEFLEEWKGGGGDGFSSSNRVHIHDISLQVVDEVTLNDILSGVYGLPETEFYSQLIYKVSAGNIYLALQCVRQLCEEELLFRCEETNEWKWDFSQLQAQDDATAQFLLNPAFADIVSHSISQLSGPTQHLLSVASCFGVEIEVELLKLIFCEESDIVPSVENSMDEAINEGLVVCDPIIGRFAFAHDRVQQAAHALIDDVEALSFEVGYKLWKRCSPSMLSSKIFAVVTLLNKGKGEEGMLPEEDCYAVARLNLEAGQEALSIAAFSDATRYLEKGVALLIRRGGGGGDGKDGTYWRDEYKLALDLWSTNAEVQVFNHNLKRVHQLVEEACRHAKSLDDKFRVLMAQVNAVSLEGRVQEAIDMSTDILRQLGEKMPSRATTAVLMSEHIQTKVALRGKSNDVLMNLGQMEDKEKIAAANIIHKMFYFSMIVSGLYTSVLATRSVRLCLRHGTFAGSAMSFSMYAYALCCGMGNVEEGYRFGELAMSLLESQPQSRNIVARVLVCFYYGVHHRKRPLREGVEGLEKGFRVGMEVGDIENAMFNDGVMVHQVWYMGAKLEEVDEYISNGLSRRKVHDHCLSHDLIQILRQVMNKLAGRTPYLGSTELMEAVNAHTLADATDVQHSSLFHNCALLAYVFRDFSAAHEMVRKNTPALRKVAVSTFFGAFIDWIDGLTSVAMAREGTKRRQNLAVARRILKQFSKKGQDCPYNYGHMYHLLNAEYESTSTFSSPHCTTSHGGGTILDHYNLAMEEGQKEGFRYVVAFAAERAGDYMMRMGNGNAAQLYWDKARLQYLDWGATAKAQSMADLMTSSPPPVLPTSEQHQEEHEPEQTPKARSTKGLVWRSLTKRPVSSGR